MNPSEKPSNARNIRALAGVIRDGLLNKKSREHFDEQTIAEMISATVDAACANEKERES